MIRLQDKSSSGGGGGGGGLMRGIKIPQQEFALKIQGGLMREGGRICGTLRYKQTTKSTVCAQQSAMQL